MENKSTAFGKIDRPGPVYTVSLEVEVWPAGETRPRKPQTYVATEISLRGFYLRCEDPIDLPHRFNFAVLFPKRYTNENLQLIIGAARIVRREQHFVNGNETFGLEAKIEHIDKMWEGEEEKAS
ncbi:MAG TPA: hypothetical protein VJS43_04435 [Candidatus Acidoferrales bacterium]|nr:hypothetical protein [Candidatus Acidoferrales bacterium]